MKISHDLKKKNYWKLASVCETYEDKINFYDLYPDAFELDSNPGKELAKAMSYFQKEGILIPTNIKRNTVIFLPNSKYMLLRN